MRAHCRAAGRPDHAALDQRELRQRLDQRHRDGGIAVVVGFGQIREAGLQQRRQRWPVAERLWTEVAQVGMRHDEVGRRHLENAKIKAFVREWHRAAGQIGIAGREISLAPGEFAVALTLNQPPPPSC